MIIKINVTVLVSSTYVHLCKYVPVCALFCQYQCARLCECVFVFTWQGIYFHYYMHVHINKFVNQTGL